MTLTSFQKGWNTGVKYGRDFPKLVEDVDFYVDPDQPKGTSVTNSPVDDGTYDEDPPEPYYPEPDFDSYLADEDTEDIALYIPLTFTGSITVTVDPTAV